MVKRVKSSFPPEVPSGWNTHTTLNFDKLPFHLLEKPERRFLSSLTPNPFCSPQPLFSAAYFLFLLRSHFSYLLDSYCNDSLRIHLTTGECYADRMYYSGYGGSLRVFRLGLVRAYPMPLKGARFYMERKSTLFGFSNPSVQKEIDYAKEFWKSFKEYLNQNH